ncbi:MAG: CDP-alcohol phosphatidyltransferase family protein [Pseudomonadota bacterium]
MKPRDIPNTLCALRIALVAPLLWTILSGQYVLATLLFGLAGFTDLLDGYLARRFGWHTPLGALLDPIADKVLTVGVFLCLMAVGLIPRWLAALVIGRDLYIVSGSAVYRRFVGPFKAGARMPGKLTTAAMLLFVWLLLARAAVGWPSEGVTMILGATLAVLVVVSALDYTRHWARQARTPSQDLKTENELT